MTAAKSIKLSGEEQEKIQKISATMFLIIDRLDTRQQTDSAILGEIVALLRDFSEKCPPRDAREISVPSDRGRRHHCIRLPRAVCERLDVVDAGLGLSSYPQMKQLSTRWEHAL